MARLVSKPEIVEDDSFYKAFGIENPQLKAVNKIEVDPVIDSELNPDSDDIEMDPSSFEERDLGFIEEPYNENEETIMKELYEAAPIPIEEPEELDPTIRAIVNENIEADNRTIDNSLDHAIAEFNRVSEEYYPLNNNTNETTTINNDDTITDEKPTYPKTTFITKENFNKFINALNIIKNLKQNIVFENGVSYFISDNQTFLCKFNIHCPEISFQFPFANQQASQLNFLTKSGDSITVVETEDDYTFSNGTFKFQLRKSIPEVNAVGKNEFEQYYKNAIQLPKLTEYEFTDPVFLSQFLSIIKGVKRGFIEIVNDNNEVVINRGDVNSGKFELLRTPLIPNVINNKILDSQLDTLCLMYDYSKLKFVIYYDDDGDNIYLTFEGNIGDYDVTIVTNSYLNFVNRMI